MAAAAAEAGLEVQPHPLMVLSRHAGGTGSALPAGVAVRAVAPEDPELDRVWAVPAVAFGHPGTADRRSRPGRARQDRRRSRRRHDRDAAGTAAVRAFGAGRGVRTGRAARGRKLPGRRRGGGDHRRGRAAVLAPPGPWRRHHRAAGPGRAGPRGATPSSCPPATTRWPASTPGSASARSAPP